MLCPFEVEQEPWTCAQTPAFPRCLYTIGRGRRVLVLTPSDNVQRKHDVNWHHNKLTTRSMLAVHPISPSLERCMKALQLNSI